MLRNDVLALTGRRIEFRAFYDEWVERVARWTRALGCSAADCDDLVQEIFVVVHRRLPDFDGRHSAAWLYRIAARRVRDFRRSRWIASIFGPSLPLTSETLTSDVTPLSALEDRNGQALLDQLLGTLTEPQRAAFVLFEVDGYTAEEIAKMQQTPVNTVRARIFRSRQKLAHVLKRRHLRWNEP